MPLDRSAELQQIEAFLARHGATLGKPAFADTVAAALSPGQEQQRIASFKAERLSPREAFLRLYRAFRIAR
jgi:hypothetical protein